MNNKVFYTNCHFLKENPYKVLSYSPSSDTHTHQHQIDKIVPIIESSDWDVFTIKGIADNFGIGATTARYILEYMTGNTLLVKIYSHGKVAYFRPMVNEIITVMGSLQKAPSKKSPWKPIKETVKVAGAEHCTCPNKQPNWIVMDCIKETKQDIDPTCYAKESDETGICKYWKVEEDKIEELKNGYCSSLTVGCVESPLCLSDFGVDGIPCHHKVHTVNTSPCICIHWKVGKKEHDSYTIHITDDNGTSSGTKFELGVVSSSKPVTPKTLSKEEIKKAGKEYFKKWGNSQPKSDGKPVVIDETSYVSEKNGITVSTKQGKAENFPNQIAPTYYDKNSSLSEEKQKIVNSKVDYSKPYAKKGGKVTVSFNTGRYHAGEAWVKVWKLDNLNLVKEAADFYCLYDLSLDFEDVEPLFNEKRDYLEGQFSRYIDMAVGGEFRHCHGSVFGGALYKFRKKSPLHELIVGEHMNNSSRFGVWVDWFDVRKEYGLDALKVIVEGFNTLSWSSSMGGQTWSRCASVLHDYLSGNMTKTMFVDTVWSLQHNNNIVLDKAWDIDSSLAFILDCKFKGNVEAIVPYATGSVRKLWNEKRGVK